LPGRCASPGIRQLLRQIIGSVSLSDRWIYVTDGGHYENLGLVEALRRDATEIVAFDASGDPPESWVTFGEAVQTVRADLGVEIDLDPSTMRPAKGGDGAPTLVAQGTCTYPNGLVDRGPDRHHLTGDGPAAAAGKRRRKRLGRPAGVVALIG